MSLGYENSGFVNSFSPYSSLEYPDKLYLKKIAEWALEVGDKKNRSTNVKADMSDWTIFKETDFFDLYLKQLSDVIKELFWVPDDGPYMFTSAWTAVYNNGDYTVTHDHSPSFISFILCVDDGGNSHPVVFTDSGIEVEMITGKTLIFPGHLKHHVPVYRGDSPRIVLAGNIGVNYE